MQDFQDIMSGTLKTVIFKGSCSSWGIFPNEILDRSPQLRQLPLNKHQLRTTFITVVIKNEIFEDLIEHNYYRVESIRMQGMVLSVFAKRKLLNQIRHVKSDWIGTGYANFWGNKGTVSSFLNFFTLICGPYIILLMMKRF